MAFSVSLRGARRSLSVAIGIAGAAALGQLAIYSSVALSGCSEKAPVPNEVKPVRIGVSLGLSGHFDSRAAPMRQAILVAQAQINAAGGVLGRPVEFKIVDDKSDDGVVENAGVRAVAQDFVNERVAGVIGPIGSAQVLAVEEILAGAKIPMISPSATSAELTGVQPAVDRYLFRTAPSDDVQGRAVVYFALHRFDTEAGDAGVVDSGAIVDSGVKDGSTSVDSGAIVDSGVPSARGCGRMAILSVDNAYGNGLAQTVHDTFLAKGGSVVSREKVSVSVSASYKDLAETILATKPDCQVTCVYNDVGAQYMKDLKSVLAANPSAVPANFFVVGTDGQYNDGFISSARPDKSDPNSISAAEGTFGTFPDTNPVSTEYNEFRTLYQAYFPFPIGVFDTGPYASNTFDAAILMALAIEAAGTDTDGAKIRDALAKVSSGGQAFSAGQLTEALTAIRSGNDVDYKGASGNVDFDAFGNVVEDFIVWKVDGGKFILVRHISAEELE